MIICLIKIISILRLDLRSYFNWVTGRTFNWLSMPDWFNNITIPGWRDWIDILVLAFLLYGLYAWLKGTKALQVLIGLGFIGLLYFIARLLGLFMTSWLLQYLWAVILFFVVVIFQPEIRNFLEDVSPAKLFAKGSKLAAETIDELAEGAFQLAKNKIGALIVLPGESPIDEFLKGGIFLRSDVRKEILMGIFHAASPLHDGAIIIEKDSIKRVKCYLPLTTDTEFPLMYGARHRAAMGIAEKSDAICLVVSEERGEVSLFQNKTIRKFSSPAELAEEMGKSFLKEGPKKKRTQTLKEILTSNFPAKVVAICIAVFLWASLTGQKNAEIAFQIPLKYQNIPNNTIIAGDMVQSIKISLRGPERLIASLTPERVNARVDLKKGKIGNNLFEISKKDIRVPPGVDIMTINPSKIKVKLEKAKEE